MKFYTKYDRPPRDAEQNHGPRKVETAGYIPNHLRIKQLRQAGVQLLNFRNEQFDYQPGAKEYNYVDPTREPNFDMADASQLMHENKSKLLEQKTNAERKKAARIKLKDDEAAVQDADYKRLKAKEKEGLSQNNPK